VIDQEQKNNQTAYDIYISVLTTMRHYPKLQNPLLQPWEISQMLNDGVPVKEIKRIALGIGGNSEV